MTGKQTCELLKQIRKKTAKLNGIDLPPVPECTFQGECKGYCPVCDEEALLLSREIAELDGKGAKLTLDGECYGMLIDCMKAHGDLKNES